HVAAIAPVDGRAARQQGTGQGGAPVVGEGAEPGVDGVGERADQVTVGAVGEPGGAGAVADEVVAGAGEGAGQVAGPGRLGGVAATRRVRRCAGERRRGVGAFWRAAGVGTGAGRAGTPPPRFPLVAVLPLTVLLIRTAPGALMPPPFWPATLPLTVLAVSVAV